MNNNEFEAKVRNRLIKFPAVDGLSQLELSTIVVQVEKKMNKVEENLGIVDSSKIAIVAAYEFAVELYNLRQQSETNVTANSQKVEEMISKLERSVEKA
ncbi:MAG: cell division protein ZapA [Elusimicrobia bacterium]|nr:cell division protein ZapA [Elusimicrobiota bacterium]